MTKITVDLDEKEFHSILGTMAHSGWRYKMDEQKIIAKLIDAWKAANGEEPFIDYDRKKEDTI